MAVFFALAKKSMHSMAIYPVNLIMSAISGAIVLFIQASIWQALYAQGVPQSSSYAETITYIILYSTVLSALDIKIGTSIGNAVYQGSIGEDMLRPTSLQVFHLAKETGSSIFGSLTYAVPMLILSVGFFTVLPPAGIASFAAFLLTAIFGRMIAILINCIIGYSAFWLMNNWYMAYFERALMIFFGGMLIPLWFFPDWLLRISTFLPFRYINFAALEVYLGRLPLADVPLILITQAVWIALLFGVERFIWYKAQKKIVVQGG